MGWFTSFKNGWRKTNTTIETKAGKADAQMVEVGHKLDAQTKKMVEVGPKVDAKLADLGANLEPRADDKTAAKNGPNVGGPAG